jgi:hypothetical protein
MAHTYVVLYEGLQCCLEKKTGAASTSETSVTNYQSNCCNITGDHNFHQQHSENLKLHLFGKILSHKFK